MQPDATEPKTLTHEEAMVLLQPAPPGHPEAIKEMLSEAFAGEFDFSSTQKAAKWCFLVPDDEEGNPGIDDSFSNKNYGAELDAYARAKFRDFLENEVVPDRLNNLTAEQISALPEGFTPLRQWGLSVSDAEVEKALAAYWKKEDCERYRFRMETLELQAAAARKRHLG